MRALVTGGTGFLGRHLVRKLENPLVLSRNPDRARQVLGRVETHRWMPYAELPHPDVFEGVDAVFHLAGESVANGRWTDSKKKRIRDSRVLGTRKLVDGMRSLDTRPKVLVCASAVGFYGSRGDTDLDEKSDPAQDFLGKVCQEWEEEARKAKDFGVRVVSVRIGLVLGKGGGALEKMSIPFKFGVGGRISTGKQWWPWVHLDDVIGLFLHAAEKNKLSGPMNAVSPNPVTNQEFTDTLARTLKRPAIFPAPAFALRAMLGEFAEALLASQKVLPKVAQRTGYSFQHPKLEEALIAILRGENYAQKGTPAGIS